MCDIEGLAAHWTFRSEEGKERDAFAKVSFGSNFKRERGGDLLTDVSTGGDGIEKSPVDGLDRRLEVLLD